MKKSILCVAMALGLTTAFAQDLTSKKGEKYLPETGDWSIGADATPFLEYAGNFFGKTALNPSPSLSFANGGMMLQGKMFKDEKTAYRVGLRIGFGSVTTPFDATADSANIASEVSESGMNIGLSAGLEKRKGAGRLQGVYGAEAGIMFGGGSTITSTYLSSRVTGGGSVVVAPRTTEVVTGSTFSFGARAFAGVEYFILPKISIGAEFGWGLAFSSTGDGSVTKESVNATATALESKKTTVGGPSEFTLDTDNDNMLFGGVGVIRMNFHF